MSNRYYVEVWANGYIQAESEKEAKSMVEELKVKELEKVLDMPDLDITVEEEELD